MEKERDHIRKAVAVQTKVAGVRPLGLYQGKTSIQTQRLAMEEGGFIYLNDKYVVCDLFRQWVEKSEEDYIFFKATSDLHCFVWVEGEGKVAVL